MTLDDTELRALVLLCLNELARHGCAADPAVTSAMTKLVEEKARRGGGLEVHEEVMTRSPPR